VYIILDRVFGPFSINHSTVNDSSPLGIPFLWPAKAKGEMVSDGYPVEQAGYDSLALGLPSNDEALHQLLNSPLPALKLYSVR
jgi:hypothetical protein